MNEAGSGPERATGQELESELELELAEPEPEKETAQEPVGELVMARRDRNRCRAKVAPAALRMKVAQFEL
jgi:hypothetical protein